MLEYRLNELTKSTLHLSKNKGLNSSKLTKKRLSSNTQYTKKNSQSHLSKDLNQI